MTGAFNFKEIAATLGFASFTLAALSLTFAQEAPKPPDPRLAQQTINAYQAMLALRGAENEALQADLAEAKANAKAAQESYEFKLQECKAAQGK